LTRHPPTMPDSDDNRDRALGRPVGERRIAT
jgi:hypothetical protein